MIRVLPAVTEPTQGLVDGFGRRMRGLDPDSGDEVEFLELAPALIEHPGFVSSLGERVARFAAVRHASYVHLRRLDRPSADRLVLVSDSTDGWRLSQMLEAASAAGRPLDISLVIGLLRQLLPAVALFGRHNRDAAIGALAPERLIVTPQGRLVIAEHAFGPALEKLNHGRDRLWRDFRVTMAPSAGLPRSNARADAHAIGVVALSLLLGRPITDDEYPNQWGARVGGAFAGRQGETAPLSRSLASWLARALQFETGSSFQSPHESQVAFESVLASDRSYVTSSTALDEWVAAVGKSLGGNSPAPVASASAPDFHTAPDAPAAPAAPYAPETPDHPSPSTPARNPLVLALIALAVVQSFVVLWLWTRAPGAPRAGEGELVVQSRPVAARVSIDGEEKGVTPLTISLPSGAHVLELQTGKSEPRVVPLTIRAGVQTAQYIELQNVALTGGLDVRSEPAGARVVIDGQNRGVTPVTVRDLAPGDHQVVLEAGSRKVTQAVRIDAGITAQLVVPMPRR
jgi:hypothetical protein